jgi:EAL domain-containing protein (putative c-di-GMP-specific phosphodiesterase class I)
LPADRTFVVDMTHTQQGLTLVSTIINLAHSLKLKVVAEGVETEEQSRLLRLLACDEMQGFLFSKPVPGDIFETRFLAPPPAG